MEKGSQDKVCRHRHGSNIKMKIKINKKVWAIGIILLLFGGVIGYAIGYGAGVVDCIKTGA